jgi:RES domain-containing protein
MYVTIWNLHGTVPVCCTDDCYTAVIEVNTVLDHEIGRFVRSDAVTGNKIDGLAFSQLTKQAPMLRIDLYVMRHKPDQADQNLIRFAARMAAGLCRNGSVSLALPPSWVLPNDERDTVIVEVEEIDDQGGSLINFSLKTKVWREQMTCVLLEQ